jgi:hypothetical protein
MTRSPGEPQSQDHKHKKPHPAKPAAPAAAAAAFDTLEKELAALTQDQLAPIDIDIPQAVSIALGALPGIALLRGAMVEKLPAHPIDLTDKLETYALGAWYAHLLALPPAGPDNPVKPLLDEAVFLRANLLSDAEALARRGLIDAAVVEEIRKGQGDVDTANDLVALATLFTSSWQDIEHRTAATEQEIARAGDLGPELLAALGVMERGPTSGPAEVAARRQRAFTLFCRAYNETRRAVSYLRWHEGDADEIAPPLGKAQRGRGRGAPSSSVKVGGSATFPAAPPTLDDLDVGG